MLNSTTLVGRACNDPKKETVGTDKVLAKIRIACDRPTREQKTDFFEIQAWGTQADVLNKYVKKGHMFGVVGVLTYEEWTDNGNKRSKVYVTAKEIRLLQPKDKDAATSEETPNVFSGYN